MLLVALAVAPGIFWMWYFLQRDRLRPEPRHLIIRVFFLGAGAALPAALLEFGALAIGARFEVPGLLSLIVAALVIGFVEEGTKLTAVLLGVYRHAEFNEILDGIIYTVAASLGFATLENILYVIQGGAGVGVARALLSVPGHAFFGALMGFYVGVAKFAGDRGPQWIVWGLLLAVLAHAAYDAVLFTRSLLALTVGPLVLVLWWRAVVHTRRARALDDQRFGGAA